MANPYHHALSSVKRWGGVFADYLPIHRWFDESKAHHADFRHRALRHHAEGIFLMESIFGPTLRLSTCKTCGRLGLDHYDPDLLAYKLTETHPVGTFGLRDGDHPPRYKMVPTRWVGEQHVEEDLGRIPAATDWLREIKPAPWMNRSRKLSIELEREEVNHEQDQDRVVGQHP